jgi:hypothetical protein
VPSSRKFLLHLARQIVDDVEMMQSEMNKKRMDCHLKSLQSELEIMRRLCRDMASVTVLERIETLRDKGRE